MMLYRITEPCELTAQEREHIDSLQRRLGDMPAPLAALLELLGTLGCRCHSDCNKFLLEILRTVIVRVSCYWSNVVVILI